MSLHPRYDHDAPESTFELSQRSHSPGSNVSSICSKSHPRISTTESYRNDSPGPSTRSRPMRSSSQVPSSLTGKNKHAPEIAAIEFANRDTESPPKGSISSRPMHQGSNDWDENMLAVPRTNLSILDVAALILNKQIGTGIFTTPGAVLLETKSKGLSIGLWTIGGFWTLLFLMVYLEYGNALPYNGGELVYLDEIFHRPELLATILFSGFFLALANSYGNATQFAKHILLAANSDIHSSQELDPRLIRYVAISVITLVCAIHWFSSRSGLFLNKLVAWYKVALLIVVFACGMRWANEHGSKWPDTEYRGSTKDGMAGMVLVFYSYQGTHDLSRPTTRSLTWQ
jgi:hypothetical protein